VQVGKVVNPNTLRLKAAGSGAAAHMSLHLKSQCQRAKTGISPGFRPTKRDTRRSPILLPRERMTCLLATEPQKRLASRPVKGPLSPSFDSVNSLFAILLQKTFRPCWRVLPSFPSTRSCALFEPFKVVHKAS
jgi:hypothetical protein